MMSWNLEWSELVGQLLPVADGQRNREKPRMGLHADEECFQLLGMRDDVVRDEEAVPRTTCGNRQPRGRGASRVVRDCSGASSRSLGSVIHSEAAMRSS